MSGLVKGKEYKVEDSNVEGLGGEEDRNLRKSVAKNEPAWCHYEKYMSGDNLKSPDAVKDDKGLLHHVEIWRIEKFKVIFWPRNQHGSFFSGDSYIVLHTFNDKEGKIYYDLHFWLGKDSTQDEMGTAAYKTVELDTLLDDRPVQHREVQEHESELFLKIFSVYLSTGGLRYLEGGVDSGFKHVEPEKYQPRLLHLKGRKKVRVTQVPVAAASLNAGDLFVLDLGLTIYTWTGTSAGMFEKNKGRELCAALGKERNGRAKIIAISQGDKDQDAEAFYKHLGATVDTQLKTAEEGGKDDDEDNADGKPQKILFRLSDASGKLTFKKEGEGAAISQRNLDPDDVFVLDAGNRLYIWVGKKATRQEKDKAMENAVAYMKANNRPTHLQVTRILDQHETAEFLAAVNAK